MNNWISQWIKHIIQKHGIRKGERSTPLKTLWYYVVCLKGKCVVQCSGLRESPAADTVGGRAAQLFRDIWPHGGSQRFIKEPVSTCSK